MKKFIICAAAAIVALASCSKTQVVYNDAPEEIGFKAVTGAITKAEQTTSTLSGTMGVFAFLNNTSTTYFGNTSFTLNDNNYWTNAGKFWPVTSALDFAVYAPFLDNTTFSSNVLTVQADNSSNTAIANQVDYLYGAKYYNGEDSDSDNVYEGYNKNTSYVPVVLKHAQAKVTVSFTGSDVTVTNVQLTAPVLKGFYAVTYPDATVDWTSGEANSAVTLIDKADLSDTAVSASLLVVPEEKTTITFQYKIDGSDATLDYTITPDASWAHGTHYTYTVNITPKLIKFSPTVDTTWGSGGTTTTL